MAASAAAEVQNLLRFLTQDAKIPLAEAMRKIGALRTQQLNTPEAIANSDPSHVKEVFGDDKLVKQVINAAKQSTASKKRAAPDTTLPESKRSKGQQKDPQYNEASLVLPETDMNVDELEKVTIETHRAPLFLAFAVVALEFTMPEQPLSSRLSLAQAVVSANARSKAKNIGLLTGKTPEERGWARGQPKVKVLGREIAAMRRQTHVPAQDNDSQDTIEAEETPTYETFWGVNLEELNKKLNPFVAAKLAGSSGAAETSELPIHAPGKARAYLLNAIKEKPAAMLLKTIRLLCESWTSTLTPDALDERAYSWYMTVRPEVAKGQAGWGQRGHVELSEILRLRRNP